MKKILTTAVITLTLISAPFTSAKAAPSQQICSATATLSASLLSLHYQGRDAEVPVILDSVPGGGQGTVARKLANEIFNEIQSLPTDIPESKKASMVAGVRYLTYQWCMQNQGY